MTDFTPPRCDRCETPRETDTDTPTCPACDSDRTHPVGGGFFIDAHCGACGEMFSSDSVEFRRAMADLRDALVEAVATMSNAQLLGMVVVWTVVLVPIVYAAGEPLAYAR